MSIGHLSERDVRVREHVIHQLDWDPAVDASGIGVSAENGVVTLTGYVDTLRGKLAAERAAKGVRGVRGVANDVEVRPQLSRTDAEIAQDAVRVLELHDTIPATVQVVVRHGHITLTGKVGWLYQVREAERAVRDIAGARGVINHVEVTGGSVARDVRHRLVQALHRIADLDARGIVVSVSGDVVTLAGRVTTWQQRDSAERAAASAPGITRVANDIRVEPGDEDETC